MRESPKTLRRSRQNRGCGKTLALRIPHCSFRALPWLILMTLANTGRLSAQPPNLSPPCIIRQYAFSLTLSDRSNYISGRATLVFQSDTGMHTLTLDLTRRDARTGKGMKVASVTMDDKPLHFYQDSQQVRIRLIGPQSAIRQPDRGPHRIIIQYGGVPADGLIISTNQYHGRTFFGDNWPDRAHHWLPCIDCPSCKAPVEFTVTAPAHYKVVANGINTLDSLLPHGLRISRWREDMHLYSSVMVIGVADFAIREAGRVEDIPVYSYVFPQNKTRGFRDYALAMRILPFFIGHIGPYAYEKLANVQSRTIFGGMENASAIFYHEHSVGSPDIESLMAHEIGHQWFGDAITERSWSHLWLSEGFATYMCLLYLEDRYGQQRLKQALARDRETVFAFERKRLAPIVDTSYLRDPMANLKVNLMQLLNPNTYQKGGWVLHMLRRRIGDSLFWKGLRTYYTVFRNGNATSADFEEAMEKTSGEDLRGFFSQWLYRPGHPRLIIEKYYDPATHILRLHIRQQQKECYDLALKLRVNNITQNLSVRSRDTDLLLRDYPSNSQVIADPDVDLLARIRVISYPPKRRPTGKRK